MAASLNERRLALLRRIAAGHRPDNGEATRVYALRSRGLITTRSAYAYRTAEVTEAGRRLVAGDDATPPPTLPSQPAGNDP